LRSVLGCGGKKQCCVANPDSKQPSRVFSTLDVLTAIVIDLQVSQMAPSHGILGWHMSKSFPYTLKSFNVVVCRRISSHVGCAAQNHVWTVIRVSVSDNGYRSYDGVYDDTKITYMTCTDIDCCVQLAGIALTNSVQQSQVSTAESASPTEHYCSTQSRRAASLSTKFDHHIDDTKSTMMHSMINTHNEAEVRCK
jgi:hypothetical protein